MVSAVDSSKESVLPWEGELEAAVETCVDAVDALGDAVVRAVLVGGAAFAGDGSEAVPSGEVTAVFKVAAPLHSGGDDCVEVAGGKESDGGEKSVELESDDGEKRVEVVEGVESDGAGGGG